jgi:hypothetical protein
MLPCPGLNILSNNSLELESPFIPRLLLTLAGRNRLFLGKLRHSEGRSEGPQLG